MLAAPRVMSMGLGDARSGRSLQAGHGDIWAMADKVAIGSGSASGTQPLMFNIMITIG